MMIRVLVLCTILLSMGSTGCVGEGDLQIFRADIMALERSQRQRERVLMRQLDAFEIRAAQPIEDQETFRRGVEQRAIAVQELRAEVKALGDSVQSLHHRMPLDADAVSAMQVKLDELDTRLDTVADRLPVPKSPKESPSKASKNRPKDEPQNQAVPSAAASPPERPAPAAGQPELAVAKSEGVPSPSLTPSSSYPAKQLYQEALKVYQEGAYDGAMALFKQFLYQHGKSPLAGDVQYWLGESLYAQRQYEKAVVAFDDVMQKYPDDAKVPAAMFKQALAFAELRDINSARLILEQIREKYANSPEANQAAEKLKQLRY
jgi:tol-pal system protein YbgF